MKRDVYIRHEPNHHALLVVYADRAPRARKLFAQFDDRHKTIADVEKYVRENQIVRLVCAISGKAI